MSLTHPVPCPTRSTHGIGNGDLRTTTLSCGFRRHTSRPSIESSAGARARGEISSRTTPCPGRIIGLKLRERGAMGVRRRASVSG